MTKFDAVAEIRQAIIDLVAAHDKGDVDDEAFLKSHKKLAQRFYKENQEILGHDQYKAAKDDPEYLFKLVLLAYHYYRDEGWEGVLH